MFYFKKKIKRRYKLIAIGIFIAFCFIIIFLLKPILFKNWLDYPSELRAKIAFLKWQESFTYDCYGECLRDRQILKQIFLLHYDKNSLKFIDQLYEEFLHSSNLDYSFEIINVLKEINFTLDNKWPDLIKANISSESKAYLLQNFPESFKDNLILKENLITNVYNHQLDNSVKSSNLLALSIFENERIRELYLEIILGQYALDLKIVALRKISHLNEEQLNRLSLALLNNSFGLPINSRLVWLISDYYQKYPSQVTEILFQVYSNDSLDVFSRGFSALALNNLLSENLKIPELDEQAWQQYYQYY